MPTMLLLSLAALFMLYYSPPVVLSSTIKP